jgi:hypothetical protein
MTRALGYSALGAYSSSICHYCGKHATTGDHIVPKSAFDVHQSALPYWWRQHNIVPACGPCNEFKAHFRSDCLCAQCEWVWPRALALFLPDGYVVRVRRVIKVGMARL